MRKTLKRILKKCDFISPEITLFYRGIDSHSSIFSGILSILLLIGIIFLIIYLSIDLIKKQNPTSFYYTKFVDDIGEYPLNSSQILHYLGMYDTSNLEVKINTKAINIIGININDGAFLKNTDISIYSHWIYEDCEESDLGDMKNKLSDSQKDNFTNCLCISKYYDNVTKKIISKNDKSFVYPSLMHGASNSKNFEYGVYFKKCQNNTFLNNNNCLSESGIENFLNNIIGYEIYFIDHSINVDNYKEPIINSIHRITSEINSNSFVLNHLNFNPSVLRTNEGMFFDTEKKVNSYNFDYNEKITHNGNNEILGSFNFWIQNTEDTYDRTYKKIQDIAGGVDGIVEIVMLIAKFVNNILIGSYLTLKDFAYEIERNLNIKKHKINSPFFNVNKMKKINKTFDHRIQSVTRTINSNKSLVRKNTFFITNSNSNEFERGFTNTISLKKGIRLKRKNNFNWFTFILNETKIKKYDIIEKLDDKREEIISEEKLIEIYINIERILEKLKRQYNNINIFNDIAGNDTKEAIEVKEIENDNDDDNNINSHVTYNNIPIQISLNN